MHLYHAVCALRESVFPPTRSQHSYLQHYSYSAMKLKLPLYHQARGKEKDSTLTHSNTNRRALIETNDQMKAIV